MRICLKSTDRWIGGYKRKHRKIKNLYQVKKGERKEFFLKALPNSNLKA